MKIILAIDDDHFGNLIAEFVEGHDWPEGSIIRIVNVVEWSPKEARFSQPLREWMDHNLEDASERVANICKRLEKKFPNFEFESLVVEGKPTERILEMCQGWPADALVVGSHNRKGLQLFLAGSVSTALVKAAPCSVFVVKDKTEDLNNQLSHAQLATR